MKPKISGGNNAMKPRVAIACQGGGSQTAFTAGVLKALFENKIQDLWFLWLESRKS